MRDKMTLPNLYLHQEEQKNLTRTSLATHGRSILCANPGVGKTRMAKWMLGSALTRPIREDQSGHMMFAVHRRGLVDNAIGSFCESPDLPHGVIMSGRDVAYHNRIQVGSIDTMTRWFYDGSQYSTDMTFDLIIFDECHAHHTKLHSFLIGHDKKRKELGLHRAYVLGLSATPQANGLADVFEEIVYGPTTQWLIDNRFLSEFRYYGGAQGDLRKLKRKSKGNEFTKASVSAAMDGMQGAMVRDWLQYAQGRSTVGFFPRLSQARDAQAILIAAGIKAEYVDGKTPDHERRALFASLNNGYIDYICNVGVIERGTDIPRIGCIQLCVAIGSVMRYRQMIGRGSRVHELVPDCIVLDHGGNVRRHGFFEDEQEWVLDQTFNKDVEEPNKAPSVECPACKRIYRGGLCTCGYEPKTIDFSAQGLAWDGRELVEIKPTRKKEKKQTCEQIMIDAMYAAGRTNQTWNNAMGIAYRKAEKQGTRMRIPKRVTVGGKTYNTIPYGSNMRKMKIRDLYDFVR